MKLTMTTKLRTPMRIFTALSIWLTMPALTHADNDGRLKIDKLPLYQQECAACHLAYPPALLPAQSWDRIMTNLSHHFGTDASLDAQTVQDISRWLQANSGGHQAARTSPTEDRITQSRWFKHEHDEVTPDVWLRPTIKSPSNCMACHTSADQGEFDEDFVRIPR